MTESDFKKMQDVDKINLIKYINANFSRVKDGCEALGIGLGRYNRWRKELVPPPPFRKWNR